MASGDSHGDSEYDPVTAVPKPQLRRPDEAILTGGDSV